MVVLEGKYRAGRKISVQVVYSMDCQFHDTVILKTIRNEKMLYGQEWLLDRQIGLDTEDRGNSIQHAGKRF